MDLAKRRELIRRSKRLKDRRGVALIMVLGAITVLTVFLTELQEETSSELSSALADRDALKAEYYARSAVNLSRLLIAIEPEVRKSIPFLGGRIPQIPVWEFTDLVLGTFNDQTGATAFNGLVNGDPTTAKNTGLTGGGHFELKVIDEDSKLNVNTASRGDPTSQDRVALQLLGLMGQPAYNPMFEGRDADNQFTDRQTLCGAIVDWADDDENLYACDPKASGPSNKGAEDNFYQTIGLSYRRKNAPLDSLDELRLVRGVSDDFWATFIDPDPSDGHKRIMTIWGQDKINVNTANAQTMLGLICSDTGALEFCSDITQIGTFLQTVSLLRSFTMGAPIFQKASDFTDMMQGKGTIGGVMTSLQLKPILFKNPKEIQKQISLTSKVFSIYATGVVPGFRRTTKVTIHAVVDFRAASGLAGAFNGLGGNGANFGFPQQVGPDGKPIPAAGTSVPPIGGTGTRAGAPPTDPSQMSPEQLAQLLATNPAGNVVYWRIE